MPTREAASKWAEYAEQDFRAIATQMANRKSMPGHQFSSCLAMVLLILLLCPGTKASDKATLSSQVSDAIVKVRMGHTLKERRDAARHLYDLTRGRNPKRIDDATIADILSLLDSSEDPVRLWVAATLGNIGPRARVAVPALQKLLSEVDCLALNKSSAEAIRYALKRMGETLPPPCKEYRYP